MKFPYRFEKAPPPSPLKRALLPVRAMIAMFLAGTIPILAAGANPLFAYYEMLLGAFGNVSAISEVFVRAAPLMLTGLAIAVAFRAKFWNIGAEGQLYAGAILGTVIAVNYGVAALGSHSCNDHGWHDWWGALCIARHIEDQTQSGRCSNYPDAQFHHDHLHQLSCSECDPRSLHWMAPILRP